MVEPGFIFDFQFCDLFRDANGHHLNYDRGDNEYLKLILFKD